MSNITTYSQLGQDLWVVDLIGKTGFFLDVGCGDGISLSNSFLLEQIGWKGISIDPFPRNYDHRINTILHSGFVYSHKNLNMIFVLAEDFGGALCDLSHQSFIDYPKTEVKSELLSDILKQYHAPSHIEYFSLDTEGSEYKILSTFPFEEYTFDCITIEHNYKEPSRTEIKNLLNDHGYIRFKEAEWDDWYISIKMKGKLNVI